MHNLLLNSALVKKAIKMEMTQYFESNYIENVAFIFVLYN